MFTWSFIFPIGITNNSLVKAKIVHIAVTPHAFQMISFTYIEKYVSVPNHRQSINKAKDKDIDLIFKGKALFILSFDRIFFILFFLFFLNIQSENR